MFMVCGEALMDFFGECETPHGVRFDARVGGSPFNVAVGLARLGQPVGFLGAMSRGFLGQRIRRALVDEGVDVAHATTVDAPTTLGLVGLDAMGSASYDFYGDRGADRHLHVADLPELRDDVAALHLGSYAMVVQPIAGALRQLVDREHGRRLIAYDPNVRLNVEPDVDRWRDSVVWMSRRCHLLKASSEDLALLRPGQNLRAVAADLLALGVSLVVVTHGSGGVAAFTRSESFELPANLVAVVDTVGAGDTFQAAMLAWLAEQGLLSIAGLASLEAAQMTSMLRFAGAAAAITCTRRGADMPRRGELPASFA